MKRFVDLIAALAFALSLAACQTSATQDTNTARESNQKMNSALNNSSAPPQGSGELGGDTGSAAIHQPP